MFININKNLCITKAFNWCWMYSQRCGPDAYVTNFTNGVTVIVLQYLEIVCIKTQTWWFKHFRKIKNTIPGMLVEREKDPGYPRMW